MNTSELIERFEIFDDWEERYGYLIELGRKLEPLTDEERVDVNKVRGCVSQVWLVHELRDGRHFYRADSDAFIVKGLAAILMLLYSGRTTQQVSDIDIVATFEEIGLSSHLTPSRRNGFFSMVQRIQRYAGV
ncbi:MAG: cysteine desulfuration protein SufE [Kiritimatiellia bacterium]|jgi:cysteine desulfuration protein SufE